MLRRQLVLTYFLIPARTDRSLAGKPNRRTPEIPDWRVDLQKYVKSPKYPQLWPASCRTATMAEGRMQATQITSTQ